MIHVTFPDGAQRSYPEGTTGLEIATGISPSLAKRTVAMALDGAARRSRRPDQGRCEARIHRPRGSARPRTDPPRYGSRSGRGRADPLSRNAGHHRPGDRGRLLLRFLSRDAVHAGGFRRDRGQDARDRRARQALHQGAVEPRRGEKFLREEGRSLQDRTRRCDPGRSGPEDLQAGRLARPLPRPAHDLDRQDRHGVQADEGRRRLLARRFDQADAVAHLWNGLRQAGRSRRASASARGGRQTRPPSPRPGDGPVPLPGGRTRAPSSGTRRAGRCSRR